MSRLKRPRALQHLEAHPDMRATLQQQSDLQQVLAAAVAANDRIEFCHRLGLSWPTARRHLWAHRAAVLEHVAARLAQAKSDLLQDAAHLDKLKIGVRENEIARLGSLWVRRYLQSPIL